MIKQYVTLGLENRLTSGSINSYF